MTGQSLKLENSWSSDKYIMSSPMTERYFDTWHLKKFLVICTTEIAGDVLLKMQKYVTVMWNIFEIPCG